MNIDPKYILPVIVKPFCKFYQTRINGGTYLKSPFPLAVTLNRAEACLCSSSEMRACNACKMSTTVRRTVLLSMPFAWGVGVFLKYVLIGPK
jgi:hypothetical protein